LKINEAIKKIKSGDIKSLSVLPPGIEPGS
jgi:hypothetical protein